MFLFDISSFNLALQNLNPIFQGLAEMGASRLINGNIKLIDLTRMVSAEEAVGEVPMNWMLG